MSKQTTKTVNSVEETFEVKIRKEDIEQVIKSASVLVEELTLVFDQEGLTYRAMDPSHVALLDVSLPNAMFEKYDVEGEIKIGVRADEIQKIIKMFDKDSTIAFSKTKDNLLILSNRTEKYTLRLIESSKSDTPLPRIPYDSRVDLFGKYEDITTKNFIKQLEKIQVVSDYVTLETSNYKIVLSGKGDIGSIETGYEQGQVDITNNQDSQCTYSLEYIMPFVKSVKEHPLILEYSTAKPLRIEAKIANIGRLHFYLAPRVEN